MRPEVRAYIRLSIKLHELAHDNALTGAECDDIALYAHDLERQFGPSHEPLDAPTDPVLARLNEAGFAADWQAD